MTNAHPSCHTEMANPSSCTSSVMFTIPKSSRNRCTRDTPVGSYIHSPGLRCDGRAEDCQWQRRRTHSYTRHAGLRSTHVGKVPLNVSIRTVTLGDLCLNVKMPTLVPVGKGALSGLTPRRATIKFSGVRFTGCRLH